MMFDRFKAGFFAIIASFLLAGCYLPNDFTLSMQIAPDGRYSMVYEGDLTQLQFLQRIGRNELSADEITDYIGIYERDLARDSGFKEIRYLGDARYRVRYERQGDLKEQRQFSFVRRNATFIGLRITEEGLVRLYGDRLPKDIESELTQKGFASRGSINIWTTADVLTHNANNVQQGNPTRYSWDRRSLQDPSPMLEFRLAP